MDLIGGDTTLVVVTTVLYAGVNGFIPFNGGVNDFLVSLRLSNNSDVLSFFTKGGYDGNLGPYTGPFVDSMVVWISDEKPNMGYEMEGVTRVDTVHQYEIVFTVGSGNVLLIGKVLSLIYLVMVQMCGF